VSQTTPPRRALTALAAASAAALLSACTAIQIPPIQFPGLGTPQQGPRIAGGVHYIMNNTTEFNRQQRVMPGPGVSQSVPDINERLYGGWEPALNAAVEIRPGRTNQDPPTLAVPRFNIRLLIDDPAKQRLIQACQRNPLAAEFEVACLTPSLPKIFTARHNADPEVGQRVDFAATCTVSRRLVQTFSPTTGTPVAAVIGTCVRDNAAPYTVKTAKGDFSFR
jgi:hypothetical protein